ncbi:MAG: hypothetical protein J0I88_04430, partial [Chryseobacterium sp.]|nr:hypothetical protein [Chryseobacterium sp.]
DFPQGISLSKFIKCSFEAYDNLKKQYEEFFNSSLIESKQFQLRFTKNDNIKLKDYPEIIVTNLNCIFHHKKESIKPIRYEEIKSSSDSLMANYNISLQ